MMTLQLSWFYYLCWFVRPARSRRSCPRRCALCVNWNLCLSSYGNQRQGAKNPLSNPGLARSIITNNVYPGALIMMDFFNVQSECTEAAASASVVAVVVVWPCFFSSQSSWLEAEAETERPRATFNHNKMTRVNFCIAALHKQAADGGWRIWRVDVVAVTLAQPDLWTLWLTVAANSHQTEHWQFVLTGWRERAAARRKQK